MNRTAPTVFASLTRISDLAQTRFDVAETPRDGWATGDFVLFEVVTPQGAQQKVELVNGRHRFVEQGDWILGALGTRHATLEATGSWSAIGDDGAANLLTAAGLIGRCTSRSPYLGNLMDLVYRGHAVRAGSKVTMRGSVPPIAERKFRVPVVLIVGTSMSAGKTSAAIKVIRRAKQDGLRVVGAKLTGAGRQRDILSFRDAGADAAFSFVDVGLPSTVIPVAEYRGAIPSLLSLMASAEPDLAVVEIGSSPLEPYNGEAAIAAIERNVRATILCASDPYAAVGAIAAFGQQPTFVTGIATNTIAGVELIERLTGVPALNLFEPEAIPRMWQLVGPRLDSSNPD